MKQKNKWTLETEDHYMIGDQKIIRSHSIAIPPTNGDRIDIIDENGFYHYNMTKAQFMERMTPEEYLDQTLPGLEGKDREQALKNIDWTPRKRHEQIAIIIKIKNGEITLKAK